MRLNQVTIPCADYAASVAWGQRFGLKLIVGSPPKYARFECPAEEGEEPATLSIHLVEAPLAVDWPAVYFEVKDDILFSRVILDKNSMADFIFRTKLPFKEEQAIEQHQSFWKYLESLMK